MTRQPEQEMFDMWLREREARAAGPREASGAREALDVQELARAIVVVRESSPGWLGPLRFAEAILRALATEGELQAAGTRCRNCGHGEWDHGDDKAPQWERPCRPDCSCPGFAAAAGPGEPTPAEEGRQ